MTVANINTESQSFPRGSELQTVSTSVSVLRLATFKPLREDYYPISLGNMLKNNPENYL